MARASETIETIETIEPVLILIAEKNWTLMLSKVMEVTGSMVSPQHSEKPKGEERDVTEPRSRANHSSTRRMRRLRRRRKRGIIAVLPFELHDDDVDAFLRRGLLRPGEEHDRKAPARAVCQAFEVWLDRRVA